MNIDLQYYFFDWDDNILHLDTKIVLEYFDGNEWTTEEVSTSKYAEIRNSPNYRVPLTNGMPNFNTAYSNFKDIEGRECIFLKDCVEAINNEKFAPSYKAFKKCLINGSLLFIVTARGHEPKTIKNAVSYLINNHFSEAEKELMVKNILRFKDAYNEDIDAEILEEISHTIIDEYLNECQFVGVTSKSFSESVKPEEIPLGINYNVGQVEVGKHIAINRFVNKCVKNGKKLGDNLNSISIGFSDDDSKNVQVIKETFVYLKNVYPDIKFVVYDTSNKNYLKTVI